MISSRGVPIQTFEATDTYMYHNVLLHVLTICGAWIHYDSPSAFHFSDVSES